MSTQAKAMVYATHGKPVEVTKPHSFTLNEPSGSQVLLQLLAAPINPSDVNAVEGIYPIQPPKTTDLGTSEPAAVGGNEGVFKVLAVGKDVTRFKVGDWALPAVAGFGTWKTHALVDEKTAFPVPSDGSISAIQAATIAINPTTAYQMLTEFVELKAGDYFIQNGSNSAVGRYAIQLARERGVKSINVVRDRPTIADLKADLKSLGATEVITEDELKDRKFTDELKKRIGDAEVKLGLNCVGGESATGLARMLSTGGHLVTYGGMSKQPLTFGVGMFIFSDLHCHGYWLSHWAKKHPEKRYQLMLDLLKLYGEGKVVDAPVQTHKWSADQSEEEFAKSFHEAMQNSIDSKGKQLVVFE